METNLVVILAIITSFMIVKIAGPMMSKYWIRKRKTREARLQLRSSKKRLRKRKKPRKKREPRHNEGRGDRINVAVFQIFFSLILPYEIMFNFDDSWMIEGPYTTSGFELFTELSHSIDHFTWAIDHGFHEYGISYLLISISPLIFVTSAIMASVFRSSDRLASYRKSDGDKLAVVRILGKLHLLFFAATIIAALVNFKIDWNVTVRQLIPLDDGDLIMNWGIGIWLGGLSGILIAYPERFSAVGIEAIAGNVVYYASAIARDIWRGVKDPWKWFADLWSGTSVGTDVPFFSSFDEVRYPAVYYTSIVVTVIYSFSFMLAFAIIVILLLAFSPRDGPP